MHPPPHLGVCTRPGTPQPALGCPDGEEGTGRKASSAEREIAGFNHMNGANRPETLPNSTAYPLANPAFVWPPAAAGAGLESLP